VLDNNERALFCALVNHGRIVRPHSVRARGQWKTMRRVTHVDVSSSVKARSARNDVSGNNVVARAPEIRRVDTRSRRRVRKRTAVYRFGQVDGSKRRVLKQHNRLLFEMEIFRNVRFSPFVITRVSFVRTTFPPLYRRYAHTRARAKPALKTYPKFVQI